VPRVPVWLTRHYGTRRPHTLMHGCNAEAAIAPAEAWVACRGCAGVHWGVRPPCALRSPPAAHRLLPLHPQALVGRSSINTPRAIRVRIARSPVRRAAKPRASPAEDSVVVAAVPPPRAAAAAG